MAAIKLGKLYEVIVSVALFEEFKCKDFIFIINPMIFGIILPFKSQNLSCWNFNLLYLDYFVIFSFGFGLSAHLKLTIENLGIRNC